jgi:Secretion system C-terminal sorting domain
MKIIFKQFFLFVVFCKASININAQSISPSIINSSGGSANIGGRTFEYSIGEMTVVGTDKTTTATLTQGLLQPGTINPEGLTNVALGKILFNIYPNPVSEILNIDLLKPTTDITEMILYDAAGKVISNIQNPKFINNTYTINFSSFAFGNYILKLESPGQNFTFTINKSK